MTRKYLPLIILCLIVGRWCPAQSTSASRVPAALPAAPYTIPVLVVKYFPVTGDRIDIKVTGDWGESLAFTRQRTERITAGLADSLEQGSRYHAYKNPAAPPSLKYRIVKSFEYLEPLPLRNKPGHKLPVPDYYAIVQRLGIKQWVEDQGVKEVWLFAYHGGVLDLWESNMSSPFGDISNSDRDPRDLPILSKTYTVYHYNYQRDVPEALEDHMHQCEAIFSNVDRELFWNRFVGWFPGGNWGTASATIPRDRRAGWAHFPPNAQRDYDWANPATETSDIEDWNPEGSGQRILLSAARWNNNPRDWFVYWMQSIPGQGNGLAWRGKPMLDWWLYIGEYDFAMGKGLGFTP